MTGPTTADSAAEATTGDVRAEAVTVDPHPRLGDYRITDLSATAGAIAYLSLVALGALSTVETFVALALLVFVPLGLGIAATPLRSGAVSLPYRLAVVGQFPGGLLASGAFIFPSGSVASVLLTLPWVGVTGCTALFGLRRLLPRGVTPLPELAVDAALLYVPVGAIALVLHRAGISFHFDPIIILLTVIHYHYAGFVLSLVAGMAGRVVADDHGRFGDTLPNRMFAVATLVIVVNIALIAVGITFSPVVELIAVAFFSVAVAVFAVMMLARVVPRLDRLRRVLLVVAAVAIVWTMALALGYGYSAYPNTPELVTLSEMVIGHGTVNAFGFALPALLAWRLATPEPVAAPPMPPVSQLAARGRVGIEYFDRNDLRVGEATGMVADFDVFEQPRFDAEVIHSDVRRFYEDSADAQMDIEPDWPRAIQPFLPIYDALAGRLDQLHLPTAAYGGEDGLTSETLAVDDAADGRSNVSAWTRTFPNGAAMYVAAYATHEWSGVTYLSAAFPLPGGNLTGLLRPVPLPATEEANGLLLTTRGDSDGDGGLYLCSHGYPIRLPLDEELRVWKPNSGVGTETPFESTNLESEVFARHDIWFLGKRVVSLHYRIR